MVNSEPVISDLELQTVMLDYLLHGFPVNPLCIGRQFESSVGMVNSATNNEKNIISCHSYHFIFFSLNFLHIHRISVAHSTHWYSYYNTQNILWIMLQYVSVSENHHSKFIALVVIVTVALNTSVPLEVTVQKWLSVASTNVFYWLLLKYWKKATVLHMHTMKPQTRAHCIFLKTIKHHLASTIQIKPLSL